jgi:hypothetical protein
MKSVGDIEDQFRDFLERSGLLVSPSFDIEGRRAFFVHSPKGFGATADLLERMPGVDSVDVPEDLEVAGIQFDGRSISISETWEPWVTFLFPVQ